MINFLIPLIIFLGFPIGISLAFISPEEMISGKKYFHLLQNFLLVLILFFYFNFYNLNLLISILITVVVFLLMFYWNSKNKNLIIYTLLAVILYFSSKDLTLFAIESSLMFIYGIPTGSLLAPKKKKEVFLIVLKHALFIVLAVLLCCELQLATLLAIALFAANDLPVTTVEAYLRLQGLVGTRRD